MKQVTIALIQNQPLRDEAATVADVTQKVADAAKAGAKFVALPEIWHHPYELAAMSRVAQEDAKLLDMLAHLATEHGVYIVAGSMAVREGDKVFNRAHVISPKGDIILTHDKCHLYDVELPGLRTRESAVFTAGNAFNVVETEYGVVGLVVCYDIRFPEAVRSLVHKGAEIVFCPAAFNTVSGPDHWHLLFRARAMESQVYLAGISPARDEDTAYQAFGHSLVCDPWGDIIAEANEGPEMITAELDPARLADVRQRLPLLDHLRKDLFT